MHIILKSQEIEDEINSRKNDELITEQEAQEAIKQLYEGNFIEYLEDEQIFVEFEDIVLNFEAHDIKVYTPL